MAIVGHTGAGKTTIVSLRLAVLGRDPGGGPRGRARRPRVLRRLAPPERRRWSTRTCSCSPAAIPTTCALATRAISEDRVREACRRVAAAEFIERLPGGYSHVLEEAGKTCQRGRAAAPLLRAGAGLRPRDPRPRRGDVERRQPHRGADPGGASTKLTRGRTSLVIAHRLSARSAGPTGSSSSTAGRSWRRAPTRNSSRSGGAYARLYRMQFTAE